MRPTLRLPRCLRCALLVVGLLTAACSGWCQEGEPVSVSGSVVDKAAAPVEGASVWLIDLVRDARGERTTAAVTKTAADGRFSLQATDLRRDYKGEWELAIAALAPGHALTWTKAAGSVSDLILALVPAEVKQGKVSDAAGEPLSGVRVVPRFVRRDQLGFETWFGSGLFLPREVGEALAVTSDANGSYSLPWMPRHGEVSFRLSKAGYGTIGYWPTDEAPSVFRLVEGAKIRGKLVGGDPAAFAGKTVLARSPYRGTSNQAEAVVDEDGRFVLADLHPGDWTVWLEYDPAQPWQAWKEGVEIIEAGADQEFEINLQRGVLLSGVVQDAETGRPVPDVEVYVSGADGRLPPTGPDGRYQGYVLSGEVKLHATAVGPGYRGPEGGSLSLTVPEAERFEAPVIELRRAAPVEVLVVDETGKPVPGAAIFRNPVVDKPEAEHGPFFTDELGRYVFLRIEPGTVMELIAIKDDLVTGAPVRLAAGRSRMPVRLELVAGLAPTIRGRVIAEQERPVPEAAVRVRARFDHWRGWWLRLRTDANGSFTITQLDPNRDYQVEIKAPGFAGFETEWLQAEPRGSYDLGDIVLTRAHGAARGRVVDSAGQPLGGVRVFNSGDGPEPTSVTTDADGSFTLTGLFEGPAYIFAQHPGFVFTGMRADTGGEPVTITLRRPDEPPGEPQPEPAPMRVLSEAEERALARDLILRVMEDADTERSKRRLVRLLAKADLAEARRLAAEDEGLAEEIDRALGEELLKTDPEQAIRYLQSHSDARVAANSLISAAEELAGTHPDLAREAAWTALPAARQMGEPSSAVWLAHIGRLLCDLGEEEEGKELLREAYSMVKDLGHEDMGASLRAHVARYLAPTNLPAALELVEHLEKDYQKGYDDIAAAIAPTDPEGAVAVLEGLEGLEGWIRNHGLVRVCHLVAEKDPDRAAEIAETIERPEERVLALGYIAVQLAEKDRARAVALLDEALELIPDRGPFPYAFSPGVLGRIAHFAQDVGHPDLRRFAMRVMSLRDTRRTGVMADYAWRVDLTLMTVLMPVDMQAARHILDRVSPDAQLTEGRPEFGGLGLIVCSVAMFDPGQAIEMIDQRGEELHELRRAVAEFLLTPPEQRRDWTMVQSASHRAYFLPGQAGHHWTGP